MAAKTEEVATTKVKLVKCVRYKDVSYKIGQEIEIDEKDLEEFKTAKAIKIEE